VTAFSSNQTGTVRHVELRTLKSRGTDDMLNVDADYPPPLGNHLASEYMLLSRPS
jgi:hypothetical protein